MADNYTYDLSTGVIISDTSDILAQVQQEYKDVFGEDLVVTGDTPQGLLIAQETQARQQVVNFNAAMANQLNPDLAGGIFFDAICALFGLSRAGETSTIVSGVALTGVPSTLIGAGSQAKTTAGDVFELIVGVVLDGTGHGVGDFRSVVTGAIPCGVHALDTIVSGPLGWETVLNANAGEVGQPQQSDASLWIERRETLGRQSMSNSEAVFSHIRELDGVLSLTYRENIQDTTQTIDGISLAAHSIWVCIDGGADSEIAAALLEAKTAGANWNGANLVNVVDQYSGQTYAVLFDRPTYIPFLVRVTLRRGTNSSDPAITIPQAVVDYAAGKIPKEPGLRVGDDISPADIAGGISQLQPGFQLVLVEIAPASTGIYQTTEYAITLKQRATISISSVTVVIAT